MQSPVAGKNAAEQPAEGPPRFHRAVHEQLEKDVWSLTLCVRIINAFCIATFFQPDEYYQALEPAWRMAFGSQSGAWITWEWQNQLRSSLHPVLFAAVYYVVTKVMTMLSFFPQVQALILVPLPKLVQALFAALGDYYTWKFAEKIYGDSNNVAWTALLMSLLSPWQWFCSTRTLSNSLETVFTIIALFYWPWVLSKSESSESSEKKTLAASKNSADQTASLVAFNNPAEIKKLRYCLLAAGVASILRPTSLLIWISLLLIMLTRIEPSGNGKLRLGDLCILAREIVLCGASVIIVSTISDYIYYGTLTFPPYQLLDFNIAQSVAVFYGENDWHYYLIQGLPLLLTTYLPFGVAALWSATSIASSERSSLATSVRFQLSFVTIAMISTLSVIAHKEVRFIYPLLPGLHILAAPHLLASIRGTGTVLEGTSKQAPGKKSWRLYLLVAGIIANLTIGLYTSLVHQRGVISVLNVLRYDYEATYFTRPGLPLDEWGDYEDTLDESEYQLGLPKTINEGSDDVFVGFLMPCHSTPWRSHLVHPALRAWALTCEPPLHIPANSSERASYRDEADRFYDDPVGFLHREINTKERPWPQYVVGFEGIEPHLKQYYGEVMPGWEVQERWRGFNSHWHDDERRKGDVVVWKFVDGSRAS